MAIQYEITKHAVGFPSKVLAREGGKHIYNLLVGSGINSGKGLDNGTFAAKGTWESFDLYNAAAVSGSETLTGVIREKAANGNWYVEITAEATRGALFIYTVPMIAQEWGKSWQAEANFYNAVGDVARAYELAVGDVIEVSDAGFSGTPAPNKNVTLAGNKLTVSA